MEKFEFEVGESEVGVRLDKFLSQQFKPIKKEVTRSKIQHLIDEGEIRNSQDEIVKVASQKVKVGERFIVNLPAPKPMHLVAKEIPFEIIYEDDDLLVVNKPAGLTVHPGAGNETDTLVNALLFTHQNRLSSINGEFRPGIVHRLDKDTSGLMLVAKNDFTHQALSEDLQNREIKRAYLSFVYGVLDPKNGKIDKNIDRAKNNRLKMSVARKSGRNAVTNYQTKKTFLDGFVSLIECRLESGRTHQIRVHLESEKHSLVGDQIYNGCKKTAPKDLEEDRKNFIAKFPRQALHSYKIGFIHPRSEEEMSFEIELPKDLKELEKCLKKQS